jgi:hypothetical protein
VLGKIGLLGSLVCSGCWVSPMATDFKILEVGAESQQDPSPRVEPTLAQRPDMDGKLP